MNQKAAAHEDLHSPFPKRRPRPRWLPRAGFGAAAEERAAALRPGGRSFWVLGFGSKKGGHRR